MKWFENGSGTIHAVGDFPKPKRDGFTQCGLSLEGMNEMSRLQVKKAYSFKYCLKCEQLLGFRFNG